MTERGERSGRSKKPLGHVSVAVQKRALHAAKISVKVFLSMHSVRFDPLMDYMSFWLTNGSEWVVLFCTPSGYLIEHHVKECGILETYYYAVRRIDSLLKCLSARAFQDFDTYYAIDSSGSSDRSILDTLEGLDE